MRVTGKLYLDGDTIKLKQSTTSGSTSVVAGTTASNITLTLPTVTDTLLGRVSSDTGSNRLQNKELSDDSVKFVDNSDTTKKLAFQLSGFTTGNTRTFTPADGDMVVGGNSNNNDIITKAGTQTIINKTIVAASNTITTAASGNLAATDLNSALAELQTDIDTRATSTGLTDHINDATDAHAASAITNTPSGNLAATTVQGALNELQGDIDTNATNISNHLSDATDAHDASAISSVASGNLAATDVQAALNELQSDIDTRALASDLSNHLSDTTDAHDASAISSVASGNLAATDVQAALNELQSDIDTRATSTDLTNHMSDTTTHGTTGDIVGTSDTQTLTNKYLNGGTASTSNKWKLPSDTYANLAALARSEGLTYYATDTDTVYVDDGSNLIAVGSGAGSGEKNYITNPSAKSAITGWTAVSHMTVARTTTAADLPREYTTATGIKITATASQTQSTSTYIYYDFTLDDVDLNKKLKIQWSQKQTGSYVASDLAVIITTQADRTTALHTPITTNIPAVDGVFETTFDSSSTATLSLVIRATTNMADNAGITISDVVVGPGINVQGAAVSESAAFTPTSPNSSFTLSTSYLQYRRVGSFMHISGRFSASAVAGSEGRIALPTGTVGTFSGGSVTASVGKWFRNNSSATTVKQGVVLATSGQTYITFGRDDYTTAADPSSSANANVIMVGGEIIYFDGEIIIPIAEWSGSGTVNLGPGAQVEYAYNSDVTSTANPGGNGALSSSTAGAAGVVFASAWAVGTAYQRRVQFQYPIQDDDILEIQVYRPTYGWVALTEFTGAYLNTGGTYNYGVSLLPTSTTTAEVTFSNGGYATPTGANFGTATGTAWSNLNASSYKWRVRKAKASSPVGFGLAGTDGSSGLYKAGQAPGLTTGATISAGYIGQKLSASPGTVTLTLAGTVYDATSLSLTAGVWLVTGNLSVTAAGSTQTEVNASISTTSATHDPSTFTRDRSTGLAARYMGLATRYVNVSSTTTVYLCVDCTFTGTAPTTQSAYTTFYAVRIA